MRIADRRHSLDAAAQRFPFGDVICAVISDLKTRLAKFLAVQPKLIAAVATTIDASAIETKLHGLVDDDGPRRTRKHIIDASRQPTQFLAFHALTVREIVKSSTLFLDSRASARTIFPVSTRCI